MVVEKIPEARSALIRALAATGETDAFDIINPYLNDDSPKIRGGAIIGLCRYCGVDGTVRAGHLLKGLEKSENV